jgi:hypothetical protein
MKEIPRPPPRSYALDDGRILIGEALHKWIAEQGIHWCWFFTGTFPYEASFTTADKTYLKFARKVSRAAYGNRAGRHRYVPWVRALERHKSGGWHVHAAIANCNSLDIEEFQGEWRKIAGIPQLVPYDHDQDGTGYVLKGVDFGADWRCSDEVFQLTKAS